MKKYVNGEYVDVTEEELALAKEAQEEQDRQYWMTVSYDDAVNNEIRKQYSASQEFAILRQKDEKPEDYAAYFAYCEECKAYVKEKMGI